MLNFILSPLLFLLKLLFTILIFLLLLTTVLFFKPSFIINQGSLKFISSTALPLIGVQASFDSFKSKIKNKNFFDRDISFTFENLTIDSSFLEADISLADVNFSLSFDPHKFIVTAIGPITFKADYLHYIFSPSSSAPLKWDEKFLEKIRAIKLANINLEINDLWIEKNQRINRKKTLSTLLRTAGNLSLLFNENELTWTIEGKTISFLEASIGASQLKAVIQFPLDKKPYPLNVKIKASSEIKDLGTFIIDGLSDIYALNDYSILFNTSLKSKSKELKGRVTGKIDQGRLALGINGYFLNPVSSLSRLEFKDCLFRGDYSFSESTLLDVKSSCSLNIKRKSLSFESEIKEILPREITTDFSVNLKIFQKNNLLYFSLIPFRLEANSTRSKYIEAQLIASGEASGEILKIMESSSKIKVKTLFAIRNFKAFSDRLYTTSYAIPAPFHQLKGNVICSASGDFKDFIDEFKLPLICGVSLSSEKQIFVLNLKGDISLPKGKKLQLNLLVLVNKFLAELPEIRLQDKTPQFLPDKRIVSGEQMPKPRELRKLQGKPLVKKPLPIELNIIIKTAKGHPAELITHQVANNLPIDIDVKITGDKPTVSGTLSVVNFNIEVFKQKAIVNKFIISLNEESEQSALDALLTFSRNDLDIFFTITGTVEQPYFYVKSVPPRNPNEIISILLYGSSDSLDSENLSSASDTRSAMVDGSIGLLSMYYLASTPIQSIGYNPSTQLFRAQVKIANGLSLNLGSSPEGDEQKIGFRKRIKENFYFETSVEKDEVTQEAKGVGIFKWEKRY